MRFKQILAMMLAMTLGCAVPARTETEQWRFGFGRQTILPDVASPQPLYIAGYNQAWEISGVLDHCEARAVWLQAGGDAVLLIGVDCIALDSETVGRIRDGLAALPCSVNVFSTHTHAGPDTLGLWGPPAVSGKNDAYMAALIDAAIRAGQDAAANLRSGTLHFGQVRTQGMLRDSRDPQVYDENLYQLRFEAQDAPGLRMLFYGAHAESLRGANTLLSRDFPGMLCDRVSAATGDDALFLPGAVGGLIMTKEFVNANVSAVENMTITAERLAEFALSILPENERILPPELSLKRCALTVPLDNPVFLAYKFLGILGTKAIPIPSATGYGVESELSALKLGDLTIAMIPGEIFPELVLDEDNPRSLKSIARAHGAGDLLIIGLCNDELGYIVPPDDFLVNEKAPYLERIRDAKGEDHYEETNSVGPACAEVIAAAFESLLADT